LYICLSFVSGAGAGAGVVSHTKSYYVTNWKTGLTKEIIYNGSFQKFLTKTRVSFELGMNNRLYKLQPGARLADRVRIESTAQLEEAFDYIDQNDDSQEASQSLFLYPSNNSPQSSPSKILDPFIEEIDGSGSAKSDSTKSDRSPSRRDL
jgi:hypothetical protein